MYDEEEHLEHLSLRESKAATRRHVAAQALAPYALIDERSPKEQAHNQFYMFSSRPLKDKNNKYTGSTKQIHDNHVQPSRDGDKEAGVLPPTIDRGVSTTNFEASNERRHRVYPLGIYNELHDITWTMGFRQVMFCLGSHTLTAFDEKLRSSERGSFQQCRGWHQRP